MLRINVLGGLYLANGCVPQTGAAAQPRRLAVLALLAVAGERGLSRDAVVDRLWPDTGNERGRHALTQSLYTLRRDLGTDDLFLGQKDIRLNPDLIGSDYAEFHEAVRGDAPERAVELYRGAFLQGFHLWGVDTFERWVEEQRTALAQEYSRALESAARRAAGRQDLSAAVSFLRRHAAQDPLNSRVAIRLMEALAAQGDVISALQHARLHELLVNQEFELPVDREVTVLVERLKRSASAAPTAPPTGGQFHGEMPAEARDRGTPARDGSGARVAESAPASDGSGPGEGRDEVPAAHTASGRAAPGPAEAGEPDIPVEPAPQGRNRSRWLSGAIGLAVLAAAFLGGALIARRSAVTAGSRTVVAIGPIVDYRGRAGGNAELGQPLTDMLATNLARSSGFSVISNARMLELIRQLGGDGDDGAVASAAARLAGAGELIDGSVYAITPNLLRLDVRRVDLASGAVLRAYKIQGADLLALVDSGTAELVADLGGRVPAGSLAEVSTTSVRAYQLYEEGLTKYHDGDSPAAERLFRQALDIDAGFAQAALYYARATTSGSRTETLDRFHRAVELAKHAGDRERLVIQAEWAAQNSSPALPAIAETLMIRYPEELDGYYLAAQGAVLNGEYLKAEAPLRRLIALDSLGLGGQGDRRCRACEAYQGLLYIFAAVDSQARGRRLVSEWLRRQPGSAQAWRSMAHIYVREHQRDSVRIALRIADSLEPGNGYSWMYLGSIHSASEEYSQAEQLYRTEMVAAAPADRREAQWNLAVILRQMGRLREARALAHDYRLGIKERLPPGAAPYNALLEGQILFELGQYRAAAKLFDSIAVVQQGAFDPAGENRDRIWAWVHEADALAKLHDTARLTLLADSMEVLGRNVGQARERNLHAHVRGLLARIQGRDDEAIAWFRRAMVSPVYGLTRTNYELAAIYLRKGRPAEAVRVLRPALGAGTIGANLYVTHTDLEARLAEAFDSAGQADSARLYYRKVLQAWDHPDPEFSARRDSAERAESRLSGVTAPAKP